MTIAFSRTNRFCVLAAALHAAKSGQPEKRLLVEPVVTHLRRVVLEQQARLLLGHVTFEGMKNRRARCVGLPLEDLVAEHEMIAKLGRQQFGEQPMILMSIAALRAEHHLRCTGSAKLTQTILDSFPVNGCSPVRYVKDAHLDVGTRTECGERFHLLGFALGATAGEDECSHA